MSGMISTASVTLTGSGSWEKSVCNTARISLYIERVLRNN